MSICVRGKERPSKLLLEKLDGARQRGLRHIAPLACASEIQFLCHREEITNLMHFHNDLTRAFDRHGKIGTLCRGGLDCSYPPFDCSPPNVSCMGRKKGVVMSVLSGVEKCPLI